MDYLSLLVPLAYLTILLTSLYTFSTLYRRRKLRQATSLAPYFPPHTPRDLYFSLQHLPDASTEEKQKVPDSVLRAALLNRAVEDIRRIVELRNRKPALQTLLQRGVVGDEIWQRLLRAEAEMEGEVRDVVAEANALSGGTWGATIFQSAHELNQSRQLREKLDAVRDSVDGEKRRWEERKEASRRELLGGAAEPPQTQTQPHVKKASVAAAVDTPTAPDDAAPTNAPPSTNTGEKTTGSDEDGVMVEPPAIDGTSFSGSTTSGASGGGIGGGGGGTSRRKKKGKK